MNNEIKFRVWQNDTKKFQTFPQEYVGNRCAHLCMSSEQEDSFGVYVIKSTKNRIYQIFTGLKDKNGKEIYGGDIVKSPNFDNSMVVEYREIMPSDDMTAPGIGFQFNTYPEQMEIIGNIFENPELLHK